MSSLAALPFASSCGSSRSGNDSVMLKGADATILAKDGALGGGLPDAINDSTGTDAANDADDATVVDEPDVIGESAPIDETTPVSPANTLDAGNPGDAAGVAYEAAAEGAAFEVGSDSGGMADAENDGESGALSATESLLLANRGAECLNCATINHCLDDGTQDGGRTCDDFGDQLAVGGRAAGAPRKDLCLNTLACAFNTDCYSTGIVECLCGPELLSICLTVGPALDAGPQCAVPELAGLETIVPSAAFGHLFDRSLGSGRANVLIDCMTKALCHTCF